MNVFQGWRWLDRMGVRSKFFLLIYPMMALTMALFTWLIVDLSSSQKERINQEVSEDIAERNARLLAPALWNIDLEARKRLLKVIAGEKRLLCIEIMEDAPIVVAETPDLNQAGHCDAIPESAYLVETPIVFQVLDRRHEVGLSRQWFDISRSQEDVRSEILGFSQLSLILFLVLGIFLTIGFRLVVFAPIQAMQTSLSHYNRSGIRERADWESADELGQFIQAYNEGVERQNQTEAQLLEAKSKAEDALEELKHTQDSLVQAEKLASLGSLVAGIAHEINTPVGSSLTVATTLLERLKSFRSAMSEGGLRKSQLDDLLDSVDEACGIIIYSLGAAAEQIQNFKQVAVDQTSTRWREFSLETMIDEVLSTLRPLVKHQDIRIETDIDPEIRMKSFPGPLGQVLSNLFNNSVMHGFPEDRSGTIRVNAKLAPVETPSSSEAVVVLEFSDDGVGMNEDQLKHLYDPFYTTRLGTGGSGLGMHLVYTLVNQVLKGSIEVVSEPGNGTQCILKLPLQVSRNEVKSE